MFGEPARTPYDLEFRVMDIPVRIHPLFWVLGGILGMFQLHPSYGVRNIGILLGWVIAVFAGVLVHELGHALSGRSFGSRNVWIVLEAMGGVTFNATGRTRGQRIFICAAGPLASILLGIPSLMISLVGRVHDPVVASFIGAMVWVNIGWAIINLIPVYPLDGGQIMGEMLGSVWRSGMTTTHKISIVVAILAAIGSALLGQSFLAILFAYLALNNYQRMNHSSW